MQKFLVNIDGSKEQFLYALYLAHVVNMNFDEVEFNIIRPEKSGLDLSKFSPFEIQSFSYNEKDGSSLPRAHKFAYNLHDVFNIDVFVDFCQTTTSAFWGTAFRAKQRIGISSRVRKMLLTKAVTASNLEDFFQQLLEYFGWTFDLDQVKSEFEVNGDDVLLFEKVMTKELRSQIEKKFEVQVFSQQEDQALSEELLSSLERVQYVIVNSKSDIGLFRYLNKIVVFDDPENEYSEGEVISLEDFCNKHLNID